MCLVLLRITAQPTPDPAWHIRWHRTDEFATDSPYVSPQLLHWLSPLVFLFVTCFLFLFWLSCLTAWFSIRSLAIERFG